MRTKSSYRTASKSTYEKFCSTHPNINISFEKWKEVIYNFNYFFRDYILETGEKAKLPWGLGIFTVGKKKVKKFKIFEGKEYINLPIDWKKTRAAGKRVYHLNTHTDGFRYKWKWLSGDSRLYQPDIWVFRPCRDTSRKLAEYLKRNSHYAQLYREWESKKKKE